MQHTLPKSMDRTNKLALELANALNDMDSLQAYIGFTQKYSEQYLRQVLTKVLSIPENKIRKTRGALFTYLVKQHAQNSSHYSRN
jgi:hypothetical protein